MTSDHNQPPADRAVWHAIRDAIIDPGSVTERRCGFGLSMDHLESLTAWQARAVEIAATPLIAGQERARERERIRHDLIDGDPGALEAAFREFVDDEEAADCAMIVADLLGGEQP